MEGTSAHVENVRNTYKINNRYLMVRSHMGNLGTDGEVILKCVLGNKLQG
jgi:hypothetical protein